MGPSRGGVSGPLPEETLTGAPRFRVLVEGIVLHRDLLPGRYPIRRLVEGLDTSPPLCRLFGGEDECRAALDKAEAQLDEEWGYMWVSNDDGCLHVSRKYWQSGDPLHIYIDLVHELVHVNQHHEGRDLFDPAYAYIERPTELEAYHVVVAEARRLGMSEDDLFDFLYVEWIDLEEHRKLCRTLGVAVPDRPPNRAEATETP